MGRFWNYVAKKTMSGLIDQHAELGAQRAAVGASCVPPPMPPGNYLASPDNLQWVNNQLDNIESRLYRQERQIRQLAHHMGLRYVEHCFVERDEDDDCCELPMEEAF